MARQLKVNAIAIISAINHPVIVRSFIPEDVLKYHYVAHCSLDVFEERGAPSAKFNECYFGFLYCLEDTAVYGYVTPTRLKIVVALELADAVVRDADIVSICKAVHTAYTETLANPFLRLDVSKDGGSDPSSLLPMTSKHWLGLARRIDDLGRAIGSLKSENT